MRRILGIAMVALALASAVVWAAPDRQASLLQLFILRARTDLEILANAALGDGVRPETWTFNTDLDSPTVVVDLWFDNEQLADAVFGSGQRPGGWFSATSANPDLVARNVRHDLELIADEIFGLRERPDNWNGAEPVYRCSRSIQNILILLDRMYNTRPTTPASVFEYCEAVAFEIESELLPVVFSSMDESPELQELAWALRGDLERVADELLGLNTRPESWIGNLGEESPTLLPDASTDLETLANDQLGSGQRPATWARFIPASPAASFRHLRYNLELFADELLGETQRPAGWQGDDPLYRCNPLEQAMVTIIETQYSLTFERDDIPEDDFCSVTLFTANNIAENPPEIIVDEAAEDTRFMGESEYAFSYLDVAALDFMGTMPRGTIFRAWYRNFGDSNMMFVSGDDFALYIDRRWTTLAEDTFLQLPTLEGIRPLAFCDAFWCNGPRPTPTPTGGGPLESLLAGATPPATVEAATIRETEGKTQVSWNHIRVTYLLDRPEVGTVQVALEICNEPAQVSCEPVTSVFDNATGALKPVVSQFNGLNVYEFRYGYNTNVVIESTTRVSPDIWISDPTIR